MKLLILFLLASFCFTTLTETARADMRSDALALLARLREDGVDKRFPDELRSLDATLATAELYYHLNDSRNADRYYLLALQKGALIKQNFLFPSPELQTGSSTSPSATHHATTAPTSPPAPVDSVLKPVSSAMPAVMPITDQPSPQGVTPETDGTFHSTRLTGTVGTYTVAKKDTIRLVAAKLGVSRKQLAAMNGLKMNDMLKAGSILHYNNRRIIPEHKIKDGIIINIPDRMLYLFRQGSMVFSTAVALGTPTKTDQLVWETPTGKFKVVTKAKDPTWTVPPSIQEEMRLEGKEVITSIPPGATNPLGKYAIKTSLPGILIHSTTKPWSIYTYASHGCIRVYPARMEELFKLVKPNTAGEIIYRPVKLAVTDDGRVLMEVHGDIYKKSKGLAAEAKALIRARKLTSRVDWEKVKLAVSRRAGVAEEITLTTVESQQTRSEDRPQSPS